MTGLDVFAFFVMAVMVASIVIVLILLGGLPGKIAARRDHPQAEAIKMPNRSNDNTSRRVRMIDSSLSKAV